VRRGRRNDGATKFHRDNHRCCISVRCILGGRIIFGSIWRYRYRSNFGERQTANAIL